MHAPLAPAVLASVLASVFALAASVPFPAAAAPILVARAPDGTSITLTDEVGPCEGAAKKAVWTSPDAKRKVVGCYVLTDRGAFVSFLDADRMDIPLQVLAKPTGA
ncbi:MAG: hypothetical protein HZC37_26230 [Burkholderiales bacterium]|nr:hypothetical protein [Burkholderiales bacterium]